jgi:hypothetical protein
MKKRPASQKQNTDTDPQHQKQNQPLSHKHKRNKGNHKTFQTKIGFGTWNTIQNLIKQHS